MAATVARTESWTTSIGKAGWGALAGSWLGWMFDGYETYALVLVMAPAVRQLLSPERLPKASIYVGGLLAVTLLGWAAGGVAAGVLTDYIDRKRMLMISILFGCPEKFGPAAPSCSEFPNPVVCDLCARRTQESLPPQYVEYSTLQFKTYLCLLLLITRLPYGPICE